MWRIETAGDAKAKSGWVVILAFGFLILFSGQARADSAGKISITDAIAIALQSNLGLKQANNQIDLGEIAVSQNQAAFYPDLKVTAQTSARFGKRPDNLSGQYQAETTGALSLGVSSSVNLFNGFRDTAALEKAEFELDAIRKQVSRSSQEVILETIQRFIQVVNDKELIDVNRENLAAQKQQLELVEAFQQSGKRPLADLYQQRAEVANAELKLLTAERNLVVSRLKLMQTMGMDPAASIEVEVPVVEEIVGQITKSSPTVMLDKVLAARPDAEAGKLQIEAAHKGVALSRSGYWPSLNLFGEAGTSYSSGMSGQYAFADQFVDNNPYAMVGLSLSIPIFDRSLTRSDVERSEVALENERLAQAELEQQISVELRQAIGDYQTALKQIRVAESQEKFTRQSLEAYAERYRVQAATLVELTQAAVRQLEASTELVRARFDLVIKRVAVAFYQGDSGEMISLFEQS